MLDEADRVDEIAKKLESTPETHHKATFIIQLMYMKLNSTLQTYHLQSTQDLQILEILQPVW